MMKQRLLTIGLIAGCAVLLGVNFLINAGRDEEPPVITVEENEISYTEGDDDTDLLKGISARDNSDGDLTDQVFVVKVVPVSAREAVVYYSVLDASNNVGEATRRVKYSTGKDEKESLEEEEEEKSSLSADEDGVDLAVQAPEEAVEALELEPDGVRPVMALKEDSVSIKAGETFDLMSVVAGVVDDKDSVKTLYQHIHAEGEYSTQAAGSYEIRYYVNDSDGNISDPHLFTLVVE